VSRLYEPPGTVPYARWCERAKAVRPSSISIIAQALVDNPEQVSVNEVDEGDTVVYELTVAKSDIGKVIGKEGRNAVAIRTILNAMAGKAQKKMRLELLDQG
jgi:predicted RNA-binding protein YlqC (UPF0109 family)